jgi:hypothetical protein
MYVLTPPISEFFTLSFIVRVGGACVPTKYYFFIFLYFYTFYFLNGYIYIYIFFFFFHMQESFLYYVRNNKDRIYLMFL